jgi:hypothetical protein
MRFAAVLVAALVGTPAALAWSPLPGGVDAGVFAAMLETSAGTTLAAYETQHGQTILVARDHGAPKAVVSNNPVGGDIQLVQQAGGAIQLYYSNAGGVARLQSTDDGQTWTGPFATKSTDTGGVSGAAVAPDGTPYFVQWHTNAVNVFRGVNGDVSQNAYSTCCGYDASVAIDSAGLAQVAFYSNATASGAVVYEPLGANLAPSTAIPLAPVGQHPPRVPLVADRSGTTFLAWAPGNPATGFTVVPFRNGQPAGDGVDFRGGFGGGDPHGALAVDAQDRLWAVWSGGGAVHVARSRSHGQHFGAVVSSAVPGTIYGLSAGSISSGVGSVDVIVNTGASLVEQALQPGLSVRVTAKTKKKAGKTTVVTHVAQALDDGFGVAGATFRIAGRTIRADASGKAKVPAGSGKAAAAGYVGAAFRVR